MKRIFLFGFVLLYACLVSGMRIQVHYCLGQVKNISFIYAPANPCTCPLDAEGNPMPCCQYDQMLYAGDELPARLSEGLGNDAPSLLFLNHGSWFEYLFKVNEELSVKLPVPIPIQSDALPGYLLYHSLQLYS